MPTFDEITYTIILDGNGATSGTMPAQIATLSIDTYVNENKFAKTGYHFIGWATSSTATASWITDMGELAYPTKVDETIDGKEIKLYAVWKANKYSLVFNRGEGEYGEDKKIDTKYGELATVPNADGFKKERYKFDRYKWVNTIYHGEATTSVMPRSGFETLNPNQEITNLTEENDVIFNYEVEYDEVTYTIAFDGNGATSGTMSPQRATLSVVNTRLKPNSFAKDEIPFQGWALATDSELWLPNEGLLSYPDKVDESVDGTTITLYAIWNINDYSLIFNKGDGDTGAEKVVNTRYGRIATAPNAEGYYKSRYKFGRYKWIETIYEGKATTSITPRAGFDTLSPNQTFSSLTIYEATLSYIAEYDEITYTISFDGNGATGGDMPVQIATLSIDTYVNENKFERTGYHLVGWATSSTTTDIWVADKGAVTYPTMVDESIDGQVINLYAVWEPNEYSLVFTKGSGTQGSEKRVDTRYGRLATTPNADGYFKPHYKFGRYKWVNTIYHGEATTSIAPRADLLTLNPNQGFSNLSTYEATFNYEVEYDEIHYNIHFNENGGVGHMADQPATLSETTYLHLNQFTRTGYKFVGWADSDTGPVVYADGGSIGSNLPESVEGQTVELYAKWEEIKYNVIFKNGSSVIQTNNNVSYRQNITSPQAPASDLYRFVEFRTADAASVSVINANTSVSMLTAIDGNTITYDTIFEEITFNVVFDTNGGSGSMAPVLATLSKAIVLPTNGGAISRADMGFEGWSKTNGEANPINFQDAATLPVGTFTKAQAESGSVTIYACWSYDNYILRINPNGHGSSSSRDVALSRGSVYQLVATFSDSSYNLVSYNSSSNGRGTNYAINSNYSNNCPRTAVINIYAIWQYKGGGGGPGGGGSGGGGGGGGGGIGGKLPGAGANGYVGLIVDKPGVYNVTPKGAWLFDPNVQQWVYGINVKYEDIVENMNIPYESVMNNSLECLANGIYRMNSGKYFCFDSNGLLRVGLIEFNGTIYYAETSGEFVGALCSGAKTIDGIVYEFDASGEYIKPVDGVKNIDAGIWVYNPITNTWGFMILTETGDFVAITNGMYGIKNSNNNYDNFYFDENGIMQVGIVYYNGKYHYMSEAAADRGRENVAITNTLNPQ